MYFWLRYRNESRILYLNLNIIFLTVFPNHEGFICKTIKKVINKYYKNGNNVSVVCEFT